MALLKVISGGQTGVDQAALRAAKSVGILTGGWAPKGYKTLIGPNLDLKKRYGLKEADSYNYQIRTNYNVRDSNGTLRIAEHWNSGGERSTLNAIRKYERAFHDVPFRDLGNLQEIAGVVAWIINAKIQILNVAGNSEETCPGITVAAEKFLTGLFNYCKDMEERHGKRKS